MPSKKKKYNARFPPARIKKIMQSDEEVGKVAAAVPVIISRALELFVESLLGKTSEVTTARNAKTLTPSHLKRCIMSEARFDFLKDLVSVVPDCQGDTDDVSLPDDEIARVQKQVLAPKSTKSTRTRGRPRNSQPTSASHINNEVTKDIKMEESEDEEDESDIMNLNSHSTCSEPSPSVACSVMPSFPPSSSHPNNANGIDNLSNSSKTGNSGLSLSFYREISEVDSYSDNSPAVVLNQAVDDDYDT